MKSNRRPRIFIGSSKEGIRVAEAIQQNLCYKYDAEIWQDDVFKIGISTLDNLIQMLGEFDYAILVVTPDDLLTKKNNKKQSVPRDNIIFEMGLFMGHIGKDRTFFILEEDSNIKLPSDLLGITYGTYPNYHSQNMVSALRPICSKISFQIDKLGVRELPIKSNLICEVDVYYNKNGLSVMQSHEIVSDLKYLGIRAYSKKHDSSKASDAIFIGCLVSVECVRLVLKTLPKEYIKKVKYLFRPDYPSSEGGDEAGYKIGIGYQSDYNKTSRGSTAEPVLIPNDFFELILNEETSNIEFTKMLFTITNCN